MKKKLSLFAVTLAILFVAPQFAAPVAAAPTLYPTGVVTATVTAAAANVRTGPGTNHRVVITLYRGKTVKVVGKTDNWYIIYDQTSGKAGCISGNLIKIHWPSSTPSTKTSPKPAPSPTTKPNPVTTPSVSGVSPEEQQMLNLVNNARKQAGLNPLQFDMNLQKVARLKAQDMVQNNYFSHNSPTYGSPFDMMKQFGITFKTAGENIAGNQTVQRAFDAWMNSPGHRQNILNGQYNYTGIGIAPSSTYGFIYVQEFIGR